MITPLEILNLHKNNLLNNLREKKEIPFPLGVKYDMDGIGGDNFKGFMKMLKKVVSSLNKKLKNNKPLSDNFDMHLAFLEKHNKNSFKYYPMVLDFDDGQELIGLARQYGDNQRVMRLDRNDMIRITRWFLNGTEITENVFDSRAVVASSSKEIGKLANIININSKRFSKFQIKALTEERDSLLKELEALEKEKKGISIKDLEKAKETKEIKEKIKKESFIKPKEQEKDSKPLNNQDDPIKPIVQENIKIDPIFAESEPKEPRFESKEPTIEPKEPKKDSEPSNKYNSILSINNIDDLLGDEVRITLEKLTIDHEENPAEYQEIYSEIQEHLADVALKGI